MSTSFSPSSLQALQNFSLLRSQAYIDGQWCDAAAAATFAVLDPATGEQLTQVPDMGAEDCSLAIEAANDAQAAWAARTAKDRSLILRRWYDLVLENQQDLATLIVAEQGKPMAEAMGEVAYGASFIEWFAEEARRAYGDVIPQHRPGLRSVAIKQPVGVVAAITPWNFPIAMITRKVAPALAVGCTVVVKPAEDTPLSALALAALAEEAGLPAGAFNVVTAAHGAAIGNTLCASPKVRKLSFTGSTAVGKLLAAQCADTVKRLSLELGGNAPFLVFDDADLDAAVAGAIAAKYRNAGQTCICANRFLVQDTVMDAFAEKLAAAVAQLKVGQGFTEGVTQGPLINQAAYDKVSRLVADAEAKGARVIRENSAEPRGLNSGACDCCGGTFYPPTVLLDSTPEMAIYHEEIFGPVAALYGFHDEAEAIRMANDTTSGLAAYVYARDIGRVWRVAEALEYGMIGLNEAAISSTEAPFGGVKESGVGREGSKYGLEEFLEVKYLCMGGIA
jgi:succinate-semialdehyde dehydrogenase/glutarate-semialdehyde dehydrogenase